MLCFIALLKLPISAEEALDAGDKLDHILDVDKFNDYTETNKSFSQAKEALNLIKHLALEKEEPEWLKDVCNAPIEAESLVNNAS